MNILCLTFGPSISCAHAPGYIQTFISWTLFYLSNRKPSENSTFVSCSVLTGFCQYLCLPLYRFLFEFFDHGTFGEVAKVVYALYVVVLSWNLKQKEMIQCYAYTNIANRFVFSFLWRKFSSVRIGEWWDELKNGQKLKLGDAHVTPRNIQEVQASKLGDAPEAPLLHRQKSGHVSTHYIFIASCIMHFSWSVSCFSFQFCLV
jgi:hypothetical protein